MYEPRNIVKYILLTAVWLLLVAGPFVTYGEVNYNDVLQLWSSGGGTNNTTWGLVSTRLGWGRAGIAATGTYYVATTTYELYKTGSPSDAVEAVIWDTCSTVLATSTNTVAGSSITTSATTYTFLFANVEIASGTTPLFGLRRTGSANASNYYRFRRNTTPSTSYIGNCTESISGTPNGWIYGYGWKPAASSSVWCEDGVCYTDEEMATTTAAILALGYTLQLYLAVFVFALFALLAFRWTKKLIR